MVAEARTWVDIEIAIREWARDTVTEAGRRVFFTANDKVDEPQIVIQRIGGRDDACLVQFDIWAANKAAAASLTTALLTAVDSLSRYEHDGVILLGAFIESSRWQPDVESNAPRYVVDVTFTAVAGTLASS